MYRRKAGVKKTGAKNKTELPFVIHSPNENSKWPVWWDNWTSWDKDVPLKIISIDPGITHFCLRIEERFSDGQLKTLKLIKTNIGDRSACVKKTVSNDMKLTKILKEDTKIEPEVIEIRDEDYKEAFDKQFKVYGRLYRLFDSMKDEIRDAHMVIIESQLKINYKMTRLGQHIISYFINLSLTENNDMVIVEIESKVKSELWKEKEKPKDAKKDWVKKCAVEYAKQVATDRGDAEGLLLIEQKGKVNDFADTLVQVEGFLKYVNKCV